MVTINNTGLSTEAQNYVTEVHQLCVVNYNLVTFSSNFERHNVAHYLIRPVGLFVANKKCNAWGGGRTCHYCRLTYICSVRVLFLKCIHYSKLYHMDAVCNAVRSSRLVLYKRTGETQAKTNNLLYGT